MLYSRETSFNKSPRDVLVGLVEVVRALRKDIAPTKETYAERLRKNLPSSSTLPSSLPPPSSRSPPTSTRSKKKQLQERKLVLITDEKDQPLDRLANHSTRLQY